MQSKDKKFLVDVYDKISASVTTVNDSIVAHQQRNTTVEQVMATVALEQLAMQHQILVILALMAFDPGTDAQVMPELPKKIIGFS
jgi:hypothetical protein